MSAVHTRPAHVEAGRDFPCGSRPMPALEALAVAKAHFIAREWRPVSIQPPMLAERCSDVSVVLLINNAGETAWLSSREWSMVSNPVDAFAKEMACVRVAKVQQAILAYDGEFPDAVVEMAAQQTRIKLVDAVGLRAMSGGLPPAGVNASSMSRRERLMRPARNALASVHAQATRVVDTHVLPATERFVSRRLARTLREVDGERRRLHTLVTGGMVVMGFALGFLLFNLVVFMRTPDAAPALRMAPATAPPALPAPMPPAEGYVARAAGIGDDMLAPRMIAVQSRPLGAGVQAPPSSLHPVASDAVDTTASQAPPMGPDDYALAQMRADEAMRVIAHDTPEVDAAARTAADWRRESAAAPTSPASSDVSKVDTARVGGGISDPDPAVVD